MIINFLQTRDPPILPTLQHQTGVAAHVIDGLNVAFDKNIDNYKDFGKRNTASIGSLLFRFFQYYGQEVDFEDSVMSVRMGKVLPKMQKGWHLLQDNRLCVEEPFNTSRNLANTADNTSMRGIHLELRRAFGLLSKCKLGACCEGYVPPKDESRTSEIFIPPVSRPVVTQAPPQPPKPIRSSGRGGRHSQSYRGIASSRRQSNPSSSVRGAYLRHLPFGLMPQDLQMQAQHQQHLLHDRLFQQYQYLQAQEQQLRMQLHEQALLQGRLLPALSYPHIAFPNYVHQEDSYTDNSSSRASSMTRIPLSAPIHQQRFGYASPFPQPVPSDSGKSSGSASPHIGPAPLADRRLPRRSSLTQSSTTGPWRAHSQPARPVDTAINGLLYARPPPISQEVQQDRRSSTSSSVQDSLGDAASARSLYTLPQPYVRRRPSEYVGWYIGQSPTQSPYSHSAGISPIPSHVGLAIQNGGLSPKSFSQETPLTSFISCPPVEQPPSTTDETRRDRKKEFQQMQKLTIVSSSPPPAQPGCTTTETEHTGDGKSEATTSADPAAENGDSATFSATTSEDLAFDTPCSSDDQSQADLDQVVPSKPVMTPRQQEGYQRSDQRNGLHQPSAGGPGSQGHTGQHIKPDLPHPNRSNVQKPDSCGKRSDLTLSWPLTSEEASPVRANPGGLGLAGLKTPQPLPPAAEVQTLPPSSDSTLQNGKAETAKARMSTESFEPPRKAEARGVSGSRTQDSSNLTPQANGQSTTSSLANSAATFSMPVGWQTQKKKKRGKKLNKSENDMDASLGAAELMPLDEKLRKGG